jgi:hypothetical protein
MYAAAQWQDLHAPPTAGLGANGTIVGWRGTNIPRRRQASS